MIEPTRMNTNLGRNLSKMEGKKQPLTDELNVYPKIKALDVYKSETYTFSGPSNRSGYYSSTHLDTEEALERLSQGKEVEILERVNLQATYDDLKTIKDRTVESQLKETVLSSKSELESFARIESGAKPQSKEEEVAQMLEKMEFGNFDGKQDGSFYEVLDKEGEPISSFDAMKKLKFGRIVMLRERKIKGEKTSNTGNAKDTYGKWLYDPDNLASNETLIRSKGSYGGTKWKVRHDFKELKSEVVADGIPFDSVDQLKDYLLSENK